MLQYGILNKKSYYFYLLCAFSLFITHFIYSWKNLRRTFGAQKAENVGEKRVYIPLPFPTNALGPSMQSPPRDQKIQESLLKRFNRINWIAVSYTSENVCVSLWLVRRALMARFRSPCVASNISVSMIGFLPQLLDLSKHNAARYTG